MALSDIQIDRILREYEEKRSLNRAEHERRLSEIYAKIPEYEELDRLIPDYSASLASALISGNGKKEELLSNLHIPKISSILFLSVNCVRIRAMRTENAATASIKKL